jgi:predicted nucleic acid-binding protein
VRIFVDTSAWFALTHRRDSAHRRALRVWKELRRQPTRLVTSDYVFDETITLTRVRAGHAAACRLGSFLLRSRVVEITEVTPQVRAGAWELFVRQADMEFSFTDCTSFVIMRELDLHDAFAFDEHFAQMGFRVWPQA